MTTNTNTNTTAAVISIDSFIKLANVGSVKGLPTGMTIDGIKALVGRVPYSLCEIGQSGDTAARCYWADSDIGNDGFILTVGGCISIIGDLYAMDVDLWAIIVDSAGYTDTCEILRENTLSMIEESLTKSNDSSYTKKGVDEVFIGTWEEAKERSLEIQYMNFPEADEESGLVDDTPEVADPDCSTFRVSGTCEGCLVDPCPMDEAQDGPYSKVTGVYSDELSQGTQKVSLLHVMKSNAGYYIGRYLIETDEKSDYYMCGFEEPYSRESGYYGSYVDAHKALTSGFELRDCIENNYMYGEGGLSLSGK